MSFAHQLHVAVHCAAYQGIVAGCRASVFDSLRRPAASTNVVSRREGHFDSADVIRVAFDAQLSIGTNLVRGAMVSKWNICQTDDDLDIKALNDNDAIENQYETGLDWRHFCNGACRRIFS